LDNGIIAKYIRLSMDDAKTDSMSIENQRLLLNKRIAVLDTDAEILEFIDNGNSGTNFERPAVQELLELVRQGQISCILVKDFSRFGRNALETGYFIERVFPLYRTRFISVSDGFDSAEHEGSTGGLEVSFKFLMHEYYSRDLSQKIRSAKQAKMQRGESISKNCAFGYEKVENRLEIDQTAAETVRFIFDLAANGQSLSEIAKILYNEQHPTPGEYKRGKSTTDDLSCVWNKSVIVKILRDEQYIGTYIAGKTQKPELGGKQVKVPESEWIKIPNHHPAIVEPSLFEAVQQVLEQKSEPLRGRKIGTSERHKNVNSPLKGRVVCGFCEHKMPLSQTKNTAFHCQFTRVAPDSECYRLKIPAKKLETEVYKAVSQRAKQILGNIEDNHSPKSSENEDAKRILYEQFVLGEIGEEQYKTAKAELGRPSRCAIQHKGKAAGKPLSSTVRKALGAKKLSSELVETLVDKVLVYPGMKIEVVWKTP